MPEHGLPNSLNMVYSSLFRYSAKCFVVPDSEADWCNNCANLEESAKFGPVELYIIWNFIRRVTQDEYDGYPIFRANQY